MTNESLNHRKRKVILVRYTDVNKFIHHPLGLSNMHVRERVVSGSHINCWRAFVDLLW